MNAAIAVDPRDVEEIARAGYEIVRQVMPPTGMPAWGKDEAIGQSRLRKPGATSGLTTDQKVFEIVRQAARRGIKTTPEEVRARLKARGQ
jgi:hypothetical protein